MHRNDQIVCANNAVTTLAGSVTVATGGGWTTSGSGTFADTSDLTTTYTPSAADTAAGTVTLTLTTTGNGPCNPDVDSMVITISAGIYVTAGVSQAVCANNPDVTLSGSVSGGTITGQWTTSGTGTFTPDSFALNGTYTPSPADIALATVTLTLTSTANGSCLAVMDTMIITITPLPTADAGNDTTICANIGSVSLNGSVTISTGGTWISSGSGTFTPDPNTLNATYTFSSADTAAGTVNLILTTTGNGGCNAVADAVIVTITDAPQVDAGTDQTVCANNPDVSLVATVINASGGIWSGGAGTYNPNSNTLTTIYTPSAGEISAGTVTLILTSTGNGSCNAETDSIDITISPVPIVVAGSDTVVCSDNSNVSLAGSVTFATGGVWTTSGTGTFNDSSLLNAIYTMSSADSASGSVTLTLTSTGNGTCNAVSEDMILSFFTGIFVNANADTSVCLTDSMLILNGSVSGGTSTGQWSSTGGGTFLPNDTVLNATYVFSSVDMVSGSALLILTSTGNGLCSPIVDSMLISIISGVNAGPDTIVCNNADTIQLNGSVENISATQWITTGTGIFLPDDTTLTAQYVLTPADIVSGLIVFILTSTDTAGLCPSGMDSMLLSVIPPSAVSAGADDTICADSAGIALSGTFSNASGVLWTSTGGGTFSPATDTADVVYIPGLVGIDTIVFNTIGSCDNNSDTLLLTVTQPPSVNAGADTSVCATLFNVSLGGSFTISSGAIWSTTNGTGTFTPSSTNMNPTYNGTVLDTATGTIEIILSSTGNGDCNVHTDTMYLTYTPNLISVYAGPDTVVCNGTSGIELNGSVLIAAGGTWVSSGTGTFNPSPDSLDAVYIPSGADTLAGTVTLFLTTTGNGGCAALSDSMLITFFAAPTVTAGADTTVCYDADTVFLIGSITNAGGAIWTTSGTGTFTPNDSALSMGYIPSQADVLNESVTLYLSTYQSCYEVVDSINIDLVPAVVMLTSDTIVCNDVDTLEVSGIVTGAAGGSWATAGTGVFFPDDTSLTTNYVFSAADSAAGSVTLTLTSTGVLMGCPPITRFLTIGITPSPTILAGADQIVCSNQDSVFLNGSITDAGGVWTTNGTGIFSPDSVTLNAVYILSAADTALGTIMITLTTTGSCLVLSDSMQVNITAPPIASFFAADVCLNSVTNFADQSSGSPVSWNWNFGSGNSNTTQNPQFTFDSSGTYIVSLIVMAANGCSDTAAQSVLVIPAPTAAFNAANVCLLDTVIFVDSSYAISPDFITSYLWEFGDGDTSSTQNPTHVYSTFGSYLVTLIVESSAGCKDTIQKVVVVSPSPVANFSQDNTIVSTEQSVTFTDQSSGSGNIPDTVQVISWNWDFYYESSGIDSSSTAQNPTYLYGDTGNYVIQLVVTNEYNCTDTVYGDILVHLEPIVPSGFSPDGNGENDILYVLGGPFSKLEFTVYNEWGEVIFVSTKQEKGWDGTKEGKDQPMGVYVYNVSATGIDQKEYHLWGDITLLR